MVAGAAAGGDEEESDGEDWAWDEATLTRISSTTARWIVTHRTRYVSRKLDHSIV